VRFVDNSRGTERSRLRRLLTKNVMDCGLHVQRLQNHWVELPTTQHLTMDLYIPFPDMSPSTLLSFSADTRLPPRTGKDRWGVGRATEDDRLGQPDTIVGGSSSELVRSDTLDHLYNRPEDPGLRLRAVLEGALEDLSDQEDRVYRAEVSLSPTIPTMTWAVTR
jgi:hypothetical protein